MVWKSAFHAFHYQSCWRSVPHQAGKARSKSHTDGSLGKLEVALACKATTIARPHEAGIENKGAIGATLGSIIPEVVIKHHSKRK